MQLKHSLLSQSEENYIKAIYALSEQSVDAISTNLLADKMATKASSVTDMIKRLTEKQLLTYQKYQGCSLTNEGKKIALSIVRKHRLWEVFLVEKLQFGWDEVHEIAEQLEHIQSIPLTDKLEAFLGFPHVDPHGDPIPNRDGEFQDASERLCLIEADKNDTVIVMGVMDGSPEFLQYLNSIDLRLGSELKIQDKLTFDGTMIVAIHDRILQFSQHISKRIFIQYKNS